MEPERLNALFSAINKIVTENNITVVLPLHPRTAKLLPQRLMLIIQHSKNK